MTIIPCERDDTLQRKIREYADALRNEAHLLGNHGLSEAEFYNSGLFRGAVERIRGQFSATMREKREFAQRILNYLQDQGYISEWNSAGEANRHDYIVAMPSGKTAAIELKGCLDGNNTNIFERPPHANEFIIWSICSNPGADPRHNVWSGIHTRLSAEIISRQQVVDGLIVWDMVCGTVGRSCPKIQADPARINYIGQHQLPPPCLYVFPSTVPHARNNPSPLAQGLEAVELLHAFSEGFGCRPDEIGYVDFEIRYHGSDIQRSTRLRRNGLVIKQSEPTSIRRT